jgi:hypothetical protein
MPDARSARLSRSTFLRGTRAATARFLFVTTTISSLSSAAYVASDRDARARGTCLMV